MRRRRRARGRPPGEVAWGWDPGGVAAWPDSFTCWRSGHSPIVRRSSNIVAVTVVEAPARRAAKIHRAWFVAAVTFIAAVGAAGFRATPGVLITPLQQEFGWSRGEISAAVSVNLVLFGLTSPFAAALMERFGIRRVVAVALVLVAAGSGLTVFMTAAWQLVLC